MKTDSQNLEDDLLKRIAGLEKEIESLRNSYSIPSKAEVIAGTGSWEFHPDTGIINASEGTISLFGLNRKILDYDTIKAAALPEYRPIIEKALKDLIDEDKPYNLIFKILNRVTGKIIDIQSVCRQDKERGTVIGTVKDVSEQKRKEEIFWRNSSDLTSLLSITMDLLETVEKRKALQKFIGSAVHLFGFDTGALYILENDSLLLEAAEPPLPDEFPAEFRTALLKNHPHISETIIKKKPVLINDIKSEDLSQEEKIIVETMKMQSIMYIPLYVMQKVIGVMMVASIDRKHDFTDREIELYHTLSNIGSLSIENSILFDKLNRYISELKSVITEKEITEEKLRLLNRAVEQSPASIILTDEDGIIKYVNKKFTELTGYTEAEALGKTPAFLKSGRHDKTFYKELWDTIKSGKDWLGEIMNKKKNGDFYWEKVLISPMTDENGKITHFVGVKEDITERRVMMENLINAKEKAEESDRLKTAFLHNISHEIRTPLNAIVGFSDILGNQDLSPEKKKSYNEIISSSNKQLVHIIDSIMKVSQMEAGQLSVDESSVNIKKLVTTLYNQFQPQATRRNLLFRLDCLNIGEDMVIVTDEVKLRQILSNLLDNAFKFTHEGQIAFGCIEDGGYIEFRVEDTGIGIPVDEQDKIFKRFYQASKPDSQFYSGTGLGLSICAGYAFLLGGSLDVKSSAGKGSVFTLKIPVKK
jgi:PAS domain S-box-containing protein